MSERTRVALLPAVAILVYANTLRNSFAMDDNIYVLSNASVTGFHLKGLFESIPYNNVFRPLTFVSFALNWALHGPKPIGFIIFDLLVHAAAVVLLYFVLRTLLENFAEGQLIAWVAALVFAVHPIHTEAVASISDRSEPMAAAFVFAAWLCHLNEKPVLTIVFYFMAFLSKESAVVFLPLVLAGDYARGKMQSLARYASIALAAVVSLALLWKLQGNRFGEPSVSFLDNPLSHLPASTRIPNAIRILWKYIGLLVYPVHLSSDYSYNAITLYVGWKHAIPALLATLALIAFAAWAFYRKHLEWFLAVAMFLFGFAVTCNILMPTGTIMGERLMYLPSAGFCLLVALLWIRLANYRQKLAWAVLVILVLGLGARTVVRNRDWHDNYALFTADLKSAPGSAKLHSNLGSQYMYQGRLEEATRELNTALAIYQDLPDAQGFLGVIESQKGNDEEARKLLEKALTGTTRENPNYDYISVNLAGVLMKLHQNDQALKVLNDIISKSPGYSRAWANRAVIYFSRGQMDQARTDATTALQLDPTNGQALGLLNLMATGIPGAPPQ